MYSHPLTLAFSFNLHTYIHSADYREEDGSDDNRSSSLGRSAQSDNVSLASDNQDDGTLECKLTIGLNMMFVYFRAPEGFVRFQK